MITFMCLLRYCSYNQHSNPRYTNVIKNYINKSVKNAPKSASLNLKDKLDKLIS